MNELCALLTQITNLTNELTEWDRIDDPDMKNEVRIKKTNLENQLKTLEDSVKNCSWRSDNDASNAIIEIRPGAGGVESCLFAQN